MVKRLLKTLCVFLLLASFTIMPVYAEETWESKVGFNSGAKYEEFLSNYTEETVTAQVILNTDQSYSINFCPPVDELFLEKATAEGWVYDEASDSYEPYFCEQIALALGVEVDKLDKSSAEFYKLRMEYADKALALRRSAVVELNESSVRKILETYPQIGNGLGEITGQMKFSPWITMSLGKAEIEELAKLDCIKDVWIWDVEDVAEDDEVVPIIELTDDAKKNSDYSIDGAYFSLPAEGLTAEQAATLFNERVAVYDQYGRPLSDDVILCTGYWIVNDEGDVLYTAVKGDANGDGMVSTIDYAIMENCIKNKTDLNPCVMYATSLVGINGPTTTDLMVLEKMLSGK